MTVTVINASPHVHLCMATHMCHVVQHARRLLWLARDCPDHGMCTLCCCLCRAEHVFCFLCEVCAFSCGSSSLCFISGSVASYTFLWLVIWVHTWLYMVILFCQNGTSWKAWRHCSIQHKNFNNILQHIRVLVREAADWLPLPHVFWCFSAFQWN